METQVACTRCGRLVPAAVAGSSSDPFLCLTCQLISAPAPELTASSLRVKRRVWPWLAAAGGAAATALVGVLVYQHFEAKSRYEAEYPVVPSASDRMVLTRDVHAWQKGKSKLVAALASFDSWTVRVAKHAGACPLAQKTASTSEIDAINSDQTAAPTSFRDYVSTLRDPDRDAGERLVLGGELPVRAARKLDQMLTAARRGRFRTTDARMQVVNAIANDALVVLELSVDTRPEIGHGTLDITSGYRAGKAYAFDRETGELRCAGEFEAASSAKVQVLTNMMGMSNELESVRRDFEAQTDRAIASALRVVAKPDEDAQMLGAEEEPVSPQVLADAQKACDGGEVTRCTDIAISMGRGGVRYDGKRRLELLERGCNGGDMMGCHLLGGAHLMGRGVPRDTTKAIPLYEKACAANEWLSCETLGLIYVEGKGVPRDAERGATYYARGCEHDHPGSCSDLGILYLDGIGVRADETRAAELFAQACDAGEAHGCANLASLYQEGRGVEKNEETMLAYGRRACELGDGEACQYVKVLRERP